ncbi:MAG TPA: capsular biosynthesis protein [Burkholderiaceae bacterium]|nr:capsular biosynthesis protein [Burkholderiaceae bacterium]
MKFILWFNSKRLAAAMIGVPMLMAAVYFTFFAADRYVSESIITVRQAQGGQVSSPGLAMLVAGITPAARDDTLYLRQYIHSLELMRKLDAKLHLRQHFAAQKLDPLYHLYAGTSQEWMLEYYRSRVEVLFDDSASLLTVRTQGFSPEFAHALNQAILEESERFVNAFSQRVAREQMQFAEGELQRAGDRVKTARTALMRFQARNGQMDPTIQAHTAGRIEGELQAQIAKAETELRTTRAYLNDDAYPVTSLRNQIEAMRRQLAEEQARATRGGDDHRINKVALEFQEYMLQNTFAQDAYKLALSALETSRIDASRKLKSLAVIEPPSQPETALLPRKLYSLATLFIVCVLLYGVVGLTLATIREHQD